MKLKNISFATLCAAELPLPADDRARSHILPIYATSSFKLSDLGQATDRFSGAAPGYLYSRMGNPTTDAVADKLALLETHGTDITAHAMLCSTGMAAISTLMLGILRRGDAVMTQGNIYGGTTNLLQQSLQPLGIALVYTDFTDVDQVARDLEAHPEVKLVYFESPTNPTLTCVDIAAISSTAHRAGAYAAIDNTFSTPYLQRPLALGVDFVVYSTTKYLNGHGNSILGAIIGKDEPLMRERLTPAHRNLGTSASPFEAWLLHNGLKTLPLRLDRHCRNAQQLAEALAQHPRVARINYPGLASHSTHAIAARQMRQYGGMLSFEIDGGRAEVARLIAGLQLCHLTPTLGNVDTLVMHPATMSHAKVPRELRERNGITDSLVRISVGIESAEDIIADVLRGLSHLA